MNVQIDIGMAPVERIFAETPILRHPLFHVVRDREPIAVGHTLILSKDRAGSFADLAAPRQLCALLQEPSLRQTMDGREWLFYERGRARFCTSGLTAVHAHGHVLSAAAFLPGTLAELADSVHARSVSSLDDGLALASKQAGEYLLFADSGGASFLSSRSPLRAGQKRYVREFLAARRSRV